MKHYLFTLTIGTLIIYTVFVILLFLFFHTNLFIWRSRRYEIPFGKREGTQEKKELKNPKIVYWICKNPNQKNPEDWVILLHSWGRNSARMVGRGSVYWKMGFSLVFIDARCHGQSSFSWPSNGFTFGIDAIRVAETENLERPIIHGLSAGAIAAVYFAKNRPIRALVLEALVCNYREMVYDTMRFFYLPRKLFSWMAEFLLSLNFPFDEYTPEHVLPTLDCPIFLIHGEEDRFFPAEKHFKRNLESLNGRPNVASWLVPNSKHSKMAQHPDYPKRLQKFLRELSDFTNEMYLEEIPVVEIKKPQRID